MNTKRNQGPWTHRWLVRLFTLLLGVLIYWLLGFVVDDIGSLPGPDFSLLEQQQLDASLAETSKELATQIEETQRQIQDQQARQSTLRDSTDNSQRTMNQLLDFQRLNLQHGATLSDEERQALAESQRLFLQNQQQYQQLNQQIVTLNEDLRGLQEQQRSNQTQLDQARQPIQQQYYELLEEHNLKVAGYKLAFLLPLLLIGVVLYLKYRSGTYGMLIYAFGAAVLIKVGFVMHEYFPARYVKYVLILATLAVALRILIYLLHMVAHPKSDWLNKQYREAYEAFLCPICAHPIRRGPLKYMAWTRRSIRHLAVPAGTADMVDEPYTCPACATPLYVTCQACKKIRPALLPACENCGQVTDVVAPAS